MGYFQLIFCLLPVYSTVTSSYGLHYTVGNSYDYVQVKGMLERHLLGNEVVFQMLSLTRYKQFHGIILYKYWKEISENYGNDFLNVAMRNPNFQLDCGLWTTGQSSIFNNQLESVKFVLTRMYLDTSFNSCKFHFAIFWASYEAKTRGFIDEYFLFDLLQHTALAHHEYRFSVDKRMKPAMDLIRTHLRLEFICQNIHFDHPNPILLLNMNNIFRFKYTKEHWIHSCIKTNLLAIPQQHGTWQPWMDISQLLIDQYFEYLDSRRIELQIECLTSFSKSNSFNCLSVVLMEPLFILNPIFNGEQHKATHSSSFKSKILHAIATNNVDRLYWLVRVDLVTLKTTQIVFNGRIPNKQVIMDELTVWYAKEILERQDRKQGELVQ